MVREPQPHARARIAGWGCLLALALPACSLELDPVRCLADSDCERVEELCVSGSCQPTTDPYIRIVSPASGFLNSNAAELQVRYGNFVFDPVALGGEPVPGRGHWHIYLNGDYLDFSVTDTFTLTRLPDGQNRVRAELANNDHSPLPYQHAITLEVSTESRALVITAPNVPRVSTYEVEAGATFPVTVQLREFQFAPAQINASPDPCLCRGHAHLYITEEDNAAATRTWQGAIGTATFDVDTGALYVREAGQDRALEVGVDYLLEMRLAENDHTEIEPPVFDQFRFRLMPAEGTGDGGQ